MRTHTTPRRRLAGLLSGAVAVAGTLLAVGATAAAPASAAPVETPGSCSQQGSIEKTLENGTSWYMCWNTDSKKGIVLESIYVKAPADPGYRRVLDSLALSQLNVPYDSGQHQWNDITSYGFGNQYLQRLDEAECPDGELIDVSQAWLQRSGTTNAYVTRTIPAICVQEISTGTAYRSHEQDWGSIEDELLFTDQSTELVISSVSKVDWYEYQSQYRFADTGTITAQLGATGDISPEDFSDPVYGWPVGEGATDYASSHYHNAIWRADFGIDDASSQKVRQFDSEVSGPGAVAPKLDATITELATEVNVEAEKRRFFEVYAPASLNDDQHARGYEIVFAANDPYEGNPETAPQVTFTQNKACEEFASQNQNPSCALQNVVDYASDQQSLTNPVAWVNVGFHHVVRDEDQSPMPIHWQGFSLVARDFWAQNPLTPAARDCVNGAPDGQIDSTNACGHATATAMTLDGTTQEKGTTTPVTADVTVSQLSGEGVVPAGTVSIIDGASIVASGVPLGADGTATVPLPADLAAGDHVLSAVFAPAAGTQWQTSTSEPTAFAVTAAPVAPPTTSATPTAPPTTTPTAPPAGTPAAERSATRTSLALARSTIGVGRQARLSVTVSGVAGATGTVVAYSDGKRVGTATLKNGKATFSIKKLARGKHRITVAYSGSTTALPSTSAASILKVVRT